MDKTVIFAVAGSGKTTYIVESLSLEKRTLIVTYTVANYENLRRKILDKFNGAWPANITLMRFFPFLYGFCYKPFLSDTEKARGIIFEKNPNKYIKKSSKSYYMTDRGYLYSNRIALLLEERGVVNDIQDRLTRYYDEFIIDEIQDIAGRDFSFLEQLMNTKVQQLFVGDFYQHTFDTSRDGNVNGSLFDNKESYEKRFIDRGFVCDNTTLLNSWRCSPSICKFISEKLGIEMHSNRCENEDNTISLVTDQNQVNSILSDKNILKLHYQKGYFFGSDHRNWGETKGEDQHRDVCVFLNKTTATALDNGKMLTLKPSTRNKLYVAITRAHGNVYLIYE